VAARLESRRDGRPLREPAFFPDPTEAVSELAEHDRDGNEIGFGGATVEPPGAF
jgi:hypothetical protein